MKVLLALAVLLAALFFAAVLTAALVALLRRSSRNRRGSGSLGAAMQEIEGLFVESKKHVIEAERAEAADEEEPAGDPPQK